MAKFCAQCGKEYVEDATFCNNCGVKRPTSKPQEPIYLTREIKISTHEAKEIATSLIFSAGALIFEDSPELQDNEDFETVKTTIAFINKLFKEFPEINSEDWIGHSEYNKVQLYLETSTQQATSPLTPQLKIPLKENSPTFQQVETHETVVETNKQDNSHKASTEDIKYQIIGVRTVFPEIHYTLFLTDRRIIGARKDRFDNAMESGAAVGGILGAIVGAGVDVVRGPKETKQDKLEKLTPDQILVFDDQNWEIPYSELVKVELKKPGFLQDGEIILVDPKRTFTWIFDVDKEEFETVINMFKEVVPDKLKIK